MESREGAPGSRGQRTGPSRRGGRSAAPLGSLGLVRLAAAVHVFAYQLYGLRSGYFAHHAFQLWAPSWYAFLFAAEGFGLTLSQLEGPTPDDMGPIAPYLRRQAVRLYAGYAVSVALSAAATPGSVSWSTAHLNVVPVFTWVGTTTAEGWRHRAWNGAAWHLSDMSFHLICWRLVYPKLATLSVGSCWGVLCASLLVTYTRILVSALGYMSTVTMWAPYTFHHFLGGMSLARLFAAGGVAPGAPGDLLMLEVWPRRIAASGMLALSALAAVVCHGPHPDSIQAVAPHALWLGALMPLHLLLIWALALEEGPLARLCRRWPFRLAGDASQAALVLHWNAVVFAQTFGHLMARLPMTGKAKFATILLPACLALAALVHVVVERPLLRWAGGQGLPCPKGE